jgi:WxcM-like, C-terminal
MSKLINLQTVQDPKGKLTVFERLLSGGIKRVFYIYDPQEEKRGGHRHKETTHALICQSGSIKVVVNNGKKEKTYILNSPEKCLILEPEDWREMYDFASNTILLCISNTYYDPDDYIYESYQME